MKSVFTLIVALLLSTAALAEPKIYPAMKSDCVADAESMKTIALSRDNGVPRKIFLDRGLANFEAGKLEAWELNFYNAMVKAVYIEKDKTPKQLKGEFETWCLKQLKENLAARASM